VAEGFVGVAKATSVGLGLRNLPFAMIPGHPLVQSSDQLKANILNVTLPAVLANLSKDVLAGGTAGEPGMYEVVDAGDLDYVNRLFIDKGWSEGLPIVPPTVERVEQFLSHTRRRRDEVLGTLLPDNRQATIWSIAVNGVMAGCRPEYMPVLIALVEAMADPAYGVEHSGNTPGAETLIMLNGPIIKKLKFNYTQGVMRDGFQANTSVGRFWRLYLRNVAGFLPHQTDKATYGNTWRVAVAENEDVLDEIGWPNIGVDMGFERGASTVTIARYSGGGMASSMTGSTPEELLPYLADGLVRQTFWQICFTMGVGYGTLRPLAFITPIVARTIAQAGWSKHDVKQFLFEHARMKARDFEKLLREWTCRPIWNLQGEAAAGRIPEEIFATSSDPERMVPIVWSPDHIMIAVTGDLLRPSGYMFGHNGQLGFPVTKQVRLEDDPQRR
jgi:hypothetical protein